MKGDQDSTPASPPRLVRTVSDHRSKIASSSTNAADARPAEGVSIDGSVAASTSSARKPGATRARTRSVSSNAIPVSTFAGSARSPIRTDLDGPGRGPGTPDYTLSASTPQWRRANLERDGTMNSLGQGLRLISEAERSVGPSSGAVNGRARSSSDASRSSDSSDSQKKKANPQSPLARPRLSTLRSFFSSFSANNSAATTPQGERPASLGNAKPQPGQPAVRPQPLVMPSARPAGPGGLMGLNEDSPPLTPTSDSDEQSEYQQYVNAFRQQFVPSQAARHHRPPKHQWSAAQAAADAARAELDGKNSITPPASSQWPFTPPLTTSNVTSPVASTRTFSPPTRPDSTLTTASAYQGVLPSHLVSGAAPGSRSVTPTSSTTTTSISDRPSWTYNLFDVDTYRIESVGKTMLSLLPRVQINLSSWRLSMPNLRPHLPRLTFLFMIFAASTCCIVFMLSTLPLTLPKHITSLTLAEIKEIAMSLKLYSQSSNKAFYHTLVVLGTFFTWKQSFTVPGSLIMNVVFGAMYGTYSGTLYTSALTAVGGVFCYLLSAPLAPLITTLPGLAKPLDAMRRALSPGRAARASGRSVVVSNWHGGSNGNVWTYLLVLRVLPIVPYGLMNIACGVLGVPLAPYAGTLAVGSIPWNFVTCQVGDLLQEIVEALPVDDGTTMSGLKDKAKSSAGGGMRAILDRIWNREMVVKLILLSVASLVPIVLSRYLKYRQRQQAEAEGYEAVDTVDDGEVSDEENDRAGSRRSSRLLSEAKMLPTESVKLSTVSGSQQFAARNDSSSVSRNNSIRSAWL